MCIEPSSKNLPSCRIPRTSKGYPLVDSKNKVIGHSQNCSYNNFPGQASSGTDPSIEQLIPYRSYAGKQLAKCGALVGNGSDCKKAGCTPTGCSGGDKQSAVTLKVGASAFKDTPNSGTNKFNNAYLGANIFCGQTGSTANPPTMYDPTEQDGQGQEASSELIRGRVQASTVPNAQVNNGVYTLGFK